MKTMHGAMSAILVIAICSGLDALTLQRDEWWKRRGRTLAEQRNALLKDAPCDRTLVGLLDAEIRRAGEMLAIIDRNSQHARGEKTVDDAADGGMQRIARPLVTLRILEYAVHDAGEKSRVERTRASAREYIDRLVAGSLGRPDDGLSRALAATVSPIELHYITLERFFAALCKRKETLCAKALERIRAGFELAKKKERPGAGELDDLLLAASNDFLKRFPEEKDFMETAEPLDSCATWRAVRARTERVLSNVQSAGRLLESENARMSPERMLRYLDHPGELDRAIFERAAKRYFDTTSMGTPSFTRAHDESKAYSMNIPKNPDGARMFAEIDSIRRNAAASITGAETDACFDSIRNKIDAVIEKYTREAREDFAREDELLRARKDKLGDVEAANEEDYHAARAVFREKLALANGYADKSVEFLRFLRKARSINGAELLDGFRGRLHAYGGFLLFLEDCLAGCGGCARIDSPRAHERYSLSLRRIDTVCRTLQNALSVDRHHARFLSAAQAREVKQEQKVFLRSSASLKARIDSMANAFARECRSAEAAENEAAERNERGFAAIELESIMNGIEDYYAYYMRLKHSARALPAYALRHAEIEKELRETGATATLEKLLEAGTLLPAVTDFNPETIERERRAKDFLRGELRASVSRLLTLYGAYRKKGIGPASIPRKRIEEVRAGIGRLDEVEVAGWTMNEANFREVDRKAAHRLSLLATRRYWRQGNTLEGNRDEAVPIRLTRGECTMDCSVPAGWIELPMDCSDERVVSKTFQSRDRRARISVAILPLDGAGAREAGLRWAGSAHGSVVKERWGKTQHSIYHWSLLRGAGNLVTEVYALPRGENACVVSGSARKEQYALLKPKIEEVFRSLDRQPADQKRAILRNAPLCRSD